MDVRTNASENLLFRSAAWLTVFSPLPTGMDGIPFGTCLPISSGANMMIAKAVDPHVPDRAEPANQNTFGKHNPYRNDRQIPTGEVSPFQIPSGIHACSVLAQPSKKRIARIGFDQIDRVRIIIQHRSAAEPTPSGDSLSDVDGNVPVTDRSIRGECAAVIDCVDTTTRERIWRRQLSGRLHQKGAYNTARDVQIIQRIENIWHPCVLSALRGHWKAGLCTSPLVGSRPIFLYSGDFSAKLYHYPIATTSPPSTREDSHGWRSRCSGRGFYENAVTVSVIVDAAVRLGSCVW